MINVFERRVHRADVAFAADRIACVGDVEHCVGPDTAIHDCGGLYLLPGFVEPHLHVGGSQLAMESLAELLVSRGTTVLATCFYEALVLAGPRAVDELRRRAEGTGLHVELSVFHASALGLGPFGPAERCSLADLARFLREGAAELREWSYLVDRAPVPGLADLYETALEAGATIGGHLEGLSGPDLHASAALGVASDHETVDARQALERVALGIGVQMREGSGARDLDAVATAITEHGAPTSAFSFCTDEQELASLTRDGHIDHKLRRAVGLGIAPIDAVCMATLNAARSAGLDRDHGAIAPGWLASVVGVEDLAAFRLRNVWSAGRLRVEDGRYLTGPVAVRPYPGEWRGTIRAAAPGPEDFALPLSDGSRRVRVIGVREGSLITRELVEEVEVAGGRPVGWPADLARLAVFDRGHPDGPSAVALIRGLGLRRGAFATTVNPGVMDLVVAGVDDEAMAAAASRVIALEGGIAIAADGAVAAELPLPLLGIFSEAPLDTAAAESLDVEGAMTKVLGSPLRGLLTLVGFACLAVSIPELKLCARGLVRVSRDAQTAVALEADSA